MNRLVLDTNVFASALLQPLGPPAEVLLLALSGSVQLCITAPVYAEYDEVIRRPRFRRSPEDVDAALKMLREKALWFKPSVKVRACADPDDDIFLECAISARANYIVTGNLRHFPREWQKIRVVTAREFLDLMS